MSLESAWLELSRETESGDIKDGAPAIEMARKVLDLAGQISAPVPVEKIARRLGVQVRYAPFDGDISGMAHIREGVQILGVNNLHHPHRQRFTLAHELGHLILHPAELHRQVHLDKGSLYRDSLSARGTDAFERSANAFASELLIPQRLLDQFVDPRMDLEDDDGVAKLARKFRVSVAAMHFRLNRAW
jgi:Zn-dependent peptidase ImmA (M78 family)